MRKLCYLLLLLLPLNLYAAIDTFVFENEQQRSRFQQLSAEMRCPKCQNQNLADSNSPIAKDLRNEIYKMVSDGSSDEEITDFMVARYGEFVLYKPRVTETTYILWVGPFVLLLLGIVVVVLISRRKKVAQGEPDTSTQLTDSEQARLKSILDKGKDI